MSVCCASPEKEGNSKCYPKLIQLPEKILFDYKRYTENNEVTPKG